MAKHTVERCWRIYKITCLITSKSYIGITVQSPEKRWSHHVSSVRRGKNRTLLGRSIKKHGKTAFSIEVMATVNTRDEAAIIEQEMIVRLNTFMPDGMNMTLGGEGTPGFRSPRGQETKEKIRAAKLGKKASDETRRKMSKAKSGTSVSENTRKKISDTMKLRGMQESVWRKGQATISANRIQFKIDNPRIIEKKKSGVKGIVWDSYRSKWLVSVYVGNRRSKSLGRFELIEDAIGRLKTHQNTLPSGSANESNPPPYPPGPPSS